MTGLKDYPRVIPRDLFNEAKLLKCLGRLALLCDDGKLGLLEAQLHQSPRGFAVCQDQSDGGLVCVNLDFGRDQVWLDLKCPYNSRDHYPLLCLTAGGEVRVFDEVGEPSREFMDFLRGEGFLGG